MLLTIGMITLDQEETANNEQDSSKGCCSFLNIINRILYDRFGDTDYIFSF